MLRISLVLLLILVVGCEQMSVPPTTPTISIQEQPSPVVSPTLFSSATPLPLPSAIANLQLPKLFKAFNEDALDLAASRDGLVLAWTSKLYLEDKQKFVYPGITQLSIEVLGNGGLSTYSAPSVTVAYTLDDHTVATSFEDDSIHLVSFGGYYSSKEFLGAQGKAVGVAVSPNDKRLAAGMQGRYAGGDGSVVVWDTADQSTKIVLPSYGAPTRVVFAADNTLYFSSTINSCSRGGGAVMAWHEGQTEARQVFSSSGNAVLDFAIHPQGKSIASVGQVHAGEGRCLGTSIVSVWDIANGSISHSLTPTLEIGTNAPQQLDATSAAFSPNGKLLAIGDARGRVQVWDWENETVKYTMDYDSKRTKRIVFLSDELMAYSTADPSIRIFRLPP